MSARPQFTITLGRSGQVVKRTASDVSQSDYVPASGGKRPIRERLGGNMDSPYSNGSQSRNKRQRRDSHDWRDDDLNHDKPYISDRLVGRDDLRHKLIQKSTSSRSKFLNGDHSHVDLREKLSRNAKMPLRFDARKAIPESRAGGHVGRIPPTRSADDLLHMGSLRKSYSSLTLDAPRHRSPDRPVALSRGISPPRSFNERRYVSTERPLDASRPPILSAKGVDVSRPGPFMSKPAVPVEPAKPPSRGPPIGDLSHKNFYMPEQPSTVHSLLHSLGLEKYAILFRAEEVDMSALKQMGDKDLKELGIPMGPRKKILLAVQPRSRRHPSG